MRELSHYQLPRCIHAYTKLFNDIKEDDIISKCHENLEEISKNIYEICNCQKEKNNINTYSVNLLSCLIPISQLENYNIEQNNNTNEINTNNNNINDISVRCQTFNFNPKKKGKKVSVLFNNYKLN